MSIRNRFAHLMGVRSAFRAEEPEKKDDEDDEDQTQSHAEEEDENEQNKSKKTKKAKARTEKDDEPEADDDDDDPDAEEEEDDSNTEAEDDDDDPDAEEEEDDPKTAKARAYERRRCAAIFASPAAAHNIALAAQLAFETTMKSKKAIRMLKTAALKSKTTSRMSSLDKRMARNRYFLSNDMSNIDPPDQTSKMAASILADARVTGKVKEGSL